MSILSIDFETRSTVDLKKAGVYRYAEDPSTDIWCMAWAFDDEEPEVWTPLHRVAFETFDEVGEVVIGYRTERMPLPVRAVEHIVAGGEIRAWNAQFERVIWREIMVKRYGAPEVMMEQWVCSAAEAAAMALPRDLGRASHVLGVKHVKDDKGYRLMLQMARPRKVKPDGSIIWWDVEEKKQRLFEYCKQDVRTEKAIVKALRRLTPREREIYLLDQRINDRGVFVDLDLVDAAKTIVDIGITRANARLDDLTQGAVPAVTQNAKLLSWLNEHDAETDSVNKAAIAALFERDDLAADVVEVLQLRSEAGRASIKKLDSFQRATGGDSRARGLFLYHAAGPGRWGGKLIQTQNFPRGEVKRVEEFIPLVMSGEYDAIDALYPPIVVVLSMLRSMLTAAPGHELIAGDFSAIEARVLNWLAGQDDVVDLFRAMDAGDKSRHPYKVMAWRMGRAASPDLVIKGSEDYQAGKAAELGCGFQMGWKKFIDAAWKVYRVRVTEEQSRTAVSIYRSSHDKVKQFWRDIEEACIDAVRRPGVVNVFGAHENLKAVKHGGYLYIVLPSGRPLIYPAPSLKPHETPWGEVKDQLHFWGINQVTRKWNQESAYGGLLTENVVQAVARDLLAEALDRAEKRGYPPVLHTHDEAVCEVPEGFGDVKVFEQLMSELPAWATGCPVAAEGWKGFRYRK